MDQPAAPLVPVSWGELLDKVSILAIKRERIARPEALANVEKEYRLLHAIAAPVLARAEVAVLFERLMQVNQALWDIEDAIRGEDAAGRFGDAFVRLARSVYVRNDERAEVKRQVNALLSSELVEEKSYASFTAGAR